MSDTMSPINPTHREQLESHLLEFAEAYSPWAVLLVLADVLKPLFREQAKNEGKSRAKKGRDKAIVAEADPVCPFCDGLGECCGPNGSRLPCECRLPDGTTDVTEERIKLIRGHIAREDKLLAIITKSHAQVERLIGQVGVLSDAAWAAIKHSREGSEAAAIACLDEALRRVAISSTNKENQK